MVRIVNKSWLKNIFLLLSLFTSSTVAQSVNSDSSEQHIDFEAIYQLNDSFLQKWHIKKAAQLADRNDLAEIIELQNEARLFAEVNDFETASILLDAARELAASFEKAEPEEWAGEATNFVDLSASQFTKQIIFGTDFWQFKDELAYQLDEPQMEASLNPFAGVRLLGNFQIAKFNRLETMAQFKASNEYNNAEFYFKNTIGSENDNQLIIENRFEGSKETRSFDSQYVGNILSLNGKMHLSDQVVFSVGDDFRVRNYSGADAFSDNYQQNRIFSTVQYSPTLSTRAYASYNFNNRRHAKSDSLDYDEHRIDITLFQLTAQKTSFFFENIWTRRNYFNNNSQNSFFNSYQEEYFLGDIRIGFTDVLALGLRADFLLRHYDEFNERVITDANAEESDLSLAIPDYLNFSSNPRFLFTLLGDWQAGVGYLYNMRIYRDNIINSEPVSLTDAAQINTPLQTEVLFDDYYSHGFTLSLELFRMNGFMLSITNQYEERRYPNSPDVSGRLFNHDTRINSILLFSSWKMGQNIELSTLINFDDEKARDEDVGDMKNTFLSLDFSYTF
ncbi:MAG: hypothetical protein DWQ05_00260 [Calditrichaeota bacterium]|nr:MAG: hypothetical protein DWQ05_00260 [Calditrichota bacterium]